MCLQNKARMANMFTKQGLYDKCGYKTRSLWQTCGRYIDIRKKHTFVTASSVPHT